MTEAEKAYQYFVIAVPENEEQAKAYFWARKALQSTLTPPNEPLTIEQLREMNETPIYVVTETYGSGWCILNWHGVNKSYTYFSRTGTSEGMTATPLSAKTYGDLWTAYRRPPEGEAVEMVMERLEALHEIPPTT